MSSIDSRRVARLGLAVALALLLSTASRSIAQDADRKSDSVPGQFITIEEPINSDVLSRIKSAGKQIVFKYGKTATPIIVLEFRPGRRSPGASELGASHELADFLSTELGGATIVAYVPEPLKGYAVVPVLACDEIVMGPDASLGPITPEGKTVNTTFVEPLKSLAKRKGRDADLFLGLLDKNADLRAVKTSDKRLHYVMASSLDEFKRTRQVIEEKRAWEGGTLGVLTARRARVEGFVKLLVDNRAEIVNAYRIGGSGPATDPTLFADPKPVWIQIDGLIDARMRKYVLSRIEKARQEGANLIFLGIRSDGGLDTEASNIAQGLLELKEIKTIAYIDSRAMGVSALVALACDEIVLQKSAKLGDMASLVTGRNTVQQLEDAQVESLAKRAEEVAARRGHPPAVARALVDRSAILMEARDVKTGAATFVLDRQVKAEPDRFANPVVKKDAGSVLSLTAIEASGYGLGRTVNDEEEFKGLYNLKGKPIRIEGPTWVDGVITTLNEPFVSGLLLFIGVFMLILEIKMPGVGLPAILSVLSFLLFFWSRFLGGTADSLEILLFVVGFICLMLELFVFPGFGVFGFSGVMLILVSIIMASHTFVWPTQEYEYRQMAGTLFTITSVMVSVGIGAALVARYLHTIPIVNRLVLKPETSGVPELDELTGKPLFEENMPLTYLMGETGRAVTVLRPTGRVRFGDQIVDVLADGVFIDQGALVEVIEIRGQTVLVRPSTATLRG